MKPIIFLLCISLGIASALKKPRDLVDEIRDQLNELQSIVQGEILAAHNDLDSLALEFGVYGENVAQEGALGIEQEHQTVNEQLTVIKDLANGAGVDASSCTDIREQTLNRLPEQYSNSMVECIGPVVGDAQSAARSARYLVDVTINKVHDLEFQVRQCRESILCLSPLVTEIELNKIRLPQNIRTEVQATEGLLTTMRISVDTCSDTNLSGYVALAYSILGDIQACVDRLLD